MLTLSCSNHHENPSHTHFFANHPQAGRSPGQPRLGPIQLQQHTKAGRSGSVFQILWTRV